MSERASRVTEGTSSSRGTRPVATTLDPVSRAQEVVRSAGRPLDARTRALMEPRLAHDFGAVRIHTDARAQESAAGLGARAFTLGRDIVFGAGEYDPGSTGGRRLLAHELAHVVQQVDVPTALQTKPRVGGPRDPAERIADEAARGVMDQEVGPDESVALRLRERLRSVPPTPPTIRRQAKTWGGEFHADKYNVIKSGKKKVGVDMVLRFKPGKNVNAKLIGMVQMVNSVDRGKPLAINPTVTKRSIPAKEAGAGFHIDQAPANRNPLYAVEAPPATDTKLTDTGATAGFGQHGFRFTDKSGKLQKKDAILRDSPQLAGRGKNAEQRFETTALAIKGAQEGTFYGSVQWGWRTDAAGTFSKLPLKTVSQGAPSGTFGRASEIWNKSKTSKGKSTIDLPVVDVKVIDTADIHLYGAPTDALIDIAPGVELLIGTRIRILDGSDSLVHRIEVVDGPHTGRTGYIVSLGTYRDER